MNKLQRIYFVSQYDGEVHNINDYDHIITDNPKVAEIGEFVIDGDDIEPTTLRVDEEVELWSIIEIAEFFKED